MTAALHPPPQTGDAARIDGERQSQRLVTAFVISGLVFMLLPGTFLGVWNLLDISQGHRPESVPQAWLQAHGQAQIFGWIGSFILGIGFYSLTKMKSTKTFPARAGWVAWTLWTAGVLMRWIGGVTGDAWRVLLPLSAAFEFAGFLFFYVSVRKHRPSSTGTKDKAWMRLVACATIAFLAALAVNGWMLFEQATRGTSPALPHVADQQFVVLAVWGVLVPTIWGFNARWLPVFLGLQTPNQTALYTAYALSIGGLIATFLQCFPVAEVLFLLAVLLAIDALHVWERSVNPPKLLNVHRAFPSFVRFAYGWLLISCLLAMTAARWDVSGGVWGASRHALTVGFVAAMVFAIGQRVLPAFCGMRVLWSTGLMGWSLYLLFCGCLLRVIAEPLAYENIWAPAWKILPVSAVVELTAVSLFALNIGVTILRPRSLEAVERLSNPRAAVS
ncbi:MAG: NnrS family protein [Silvibacterium sp.]